MNCPKRRCDAEMDHLGSGDLNGQHIDYFECPACGKFVRDVEMVHVEPQLELMTDA